MAQLLMPKATAVWLVENTALTFKQIAEFCGLHELEVNAIADQEVAIGMVGLDPLANGQLTQEEIDTTRNQRMAEFDRDQDGTLSLEEFEALWLDLMRPRMVDRFQHLDDDGDAVVTLEEFTEPFANVVERRDRNGDGTLSRDDFRSRWDNDDDDDDDDDDRRG